MSHYNPMLEKLQRQIQEYNKDTEAKIDQVANRQNMITLAFVVFNIIVFLVLESTLGGKEPISYQLGCAEAVSKIKIAEEKYQEAYNR